MGAKLAFVFTDIEGSTALWERHAEEMGAALQRHDEISRRVVAEHDGDVFKHTGDGVAASFADVHDAVCAAVALQLAMAAEPWATVEPIVRVGVHVGSAEKYGGDYFGPTVNRTVRLMGAAHGGQVLVSEAVAAAVADGLAAPLSLEDLGSHHFRGVDDSIRVFQVRHPELRREFPPIVTGGVPPNNLPAQTTSFVGRTAAQDELVDRLGSQRLVTLTGPGGIGKTRLAIEVAAGLCGRYQHGVWFVDLSSCRTIDDVEAAVVTTLRIPAHEDVRDFAASRDLLLLLDNCEHVVSQVAALVEWLVEAPGVSVLATSRERLDLPGESVVTVRSLGLAGEGALSPAACLFVDRACAAAPDFELHPGDEAVIETLCERLDGIPLAIELVATRLGSLSLGEVARTWTDHLELAGSRRGRSRHRTMRAAIDWSYVLLTDDERRAFERCSVFEGDFDLDAAASVVGRPGEGRREVVEVLASLVNKSMLASGRKGTETRYRMLEMLRQYARERVPAEAAEEVADRHMHWYEIRAGEAARGLRGRDAASWVNRVNDDIPNFRAAFTRAMARNRPGSALQISGALVWLSVGLGGLAEIRALHEVALARRAELSPDALLTGLNGAAVIAFAQGDYQLSSTYAEEAVSIARRENDENALAVALTLAGAAAIFEGSAPRAYECFAESFDLCRRVHDEWGLAWAQVFRGLSARMSGDFDRAELWLEDAIARISTFGYAPALTLPQINLAMVHRHRGDLERARALCAEAEAHAGGHAGLASGAVGFAGRVELSAGRIDAAERCFTRCLELAERGESKVMIAIAIEGLAAVAADRGDDEQAAVLYGFAFEFRASSGSVVPPSEREEHDAVVASVSNRMGDAYVPAFERGRTMRLDEVTSLLSARALR